MYGLGMNAKKGCLVHSTLPARVRLEAMRRGSIIEIKKAEEEQNRVFETLGFNLRFLSNLHLYGRDCSFTWIYQISDSVFLQ